MADPVIRRGVQHVLRPVVPNATHTVMCVCGFAFDAVASSGSEAMTQFLERHRHEGARFTAKKIR